MRDEPAAGLFDADETTLEAMQAFGAPQEEIDQVRKRIAEGDRAAPSPDECFPVHADNLQTVSAFLALRTQWQYAGMDGQRTGLNYAGVCAWLAQHTRPRRRRPLMQGIQTMEHAVLVADYERKQKEED